MCRKNRFESKKACILVGSLFFFVLSIEIQNYIKSDPHLNSCHKNRLLIEKKLDPCVKITTNLRDQKFLFILTMTINYSN